MPICCWPRKASTVRRCTAWTPSAQFRPNGEHLLQVINDILDLSKIEAGKLSIEMVRCSPSELLFDVQRIVKQPADAKRLPVHIEFVGNIPETIETDPTRLRQVLVNLIGNAIKFTDSGSVTLAIRLVDGESTRLVWSLP